MRQHIFDRQPPQSVEAEQAVLGAMLLNPDAVAVATEILPDADAFFVEAHQRIFGAMLELSRAGTPVDTTTLMGRLLNADALGAVGGASYIAELTNAIPTSANVAYYAKIVHEKYLLRRVIQRCGLAVEQAHTAESAGEFLESLESDIFALAQRRNTRQAIAAADLMQAEAEALRTLRSGQALSGLATGFKDVDAIMNGLRPGAMVVLAARPAVGKTALGLNIAAHVARQGKAALVFSLEMSGGELTRRLLYSLGQIAEWRLKHGLERERDLEEKLARAQAELRRMNIYLDDTPSLTPLQFRARLRRAAARHDLGVCVVDYLQLASAPHVKDNRQAQIAEISRSLQLAARECSVPLLALSQLTRTADVEKPRLSHLRESGAIEQDADVVILMSAGQQRSMVNLDIAKNRHGRTGEARLYFDADTQTFRDCAGGKVKEAQDALPPLTFDEEEVLF